MITGFALYYKEDPILYDPQDISSHTEPPFPPGYPAEQKYKIKNTKLCISPSNFLKIVETRVSFTNFKLGDLSVDRQSFNLKQVEGDWILTEINLTKVLE